MREKLLVLFSVVLISGFISTRQLLAGDIKIIKKVSGKNYKLQELKNNFLKTNTDKISTAAFKTEGTAMSKTSGMLLGGGIGLVAGGLIGGVLASNSNDDNPIDEGLNIGGGILLGGLSGLVVGGLTGYLLGK
ncbi:MAG: hypothetical protein IPL53_09105 [Ignavibacteria bacterium]|nr:hypothetical protein [Ignavibacteria bacterium]